MRRLLSGLLLLAIAAPAGAATIDQLHTLKFTTKKPATSTGLKLSVSQAPTAAGEQPPVVRRLVITLPKGSKFDLKALARCSATGEAVTKQGLSACPAATKLGTGSARLYVGAATIDAKVTLFDRKSGFLFVLTSGDTVLRTVDAVVKGRTIDATLPRVELAGGKEASLVSLKVDVPARKTGKRALIRTPATCPRSGKWTLQYVPTFNSDYGFETLTKTSPCKKRK